jgi:L-2-hydroxycarboxylate dehydrogenase (NAD+)
MQVDRSRAEDVTAAAFRARGLSESDASIAATVLVSADARGKHSHGMLRVPRFVRGIDHGNVDPAGEITVAPADGATALVDGGSRLGPVVATEAVGEAMARADDHGVGVVGVHDSNHLGMLGYYTDRVRREGYVGIAMTNTEPAMPPYGGAEPVLGTNPIAVGLPTDPPFNLDMSTSAISRGEVLHRKETGETLPEDVALDADGQPTTDPAEALEGVILPFGGPKGSGLAVAVEVLAGGLVGAAMGNDVTGTYHTENPCTKGDLFVVVDPDRMAPGFVDGASAFLSDLKGIDRAAGVDEIRLPGERSVEADRTAETVEVEADLWDEVQALAAE